MITHINKHEKKHVIKLKQILLCLYLVLNK